MLSRGRGGRCLWRGPLRIFGDGVRACTRAGVEAQRPAAANPLKPVATTPPPPRRRNVSPAWDPIAYSVPPPVSVPAHIPRPSYANHPAGRPKPLDPQLYAEEKGPKAIARMRNACSLAAEALEVARDIAKVGVTTDEVDRRVGEFVISRGGYPVGINYFGFPRGLCASVNEVALHGVPNTRPLESGDIVNFDVTVFFDNAYGDCSAMVCVGDVDEDALRLCEATRQCVEGAIAEMGPGVSLNRVGEFCLDFAKAHELGVVSEFCGHFIGRELHMKPNVLHVPNSESLELRPGMTFTIEPILIEGGCAEIRPAEEDGWTIRSKYGHWSAQWEHTVLITENGAEVLTTVGSAG